VKTRAANGSHVIHVSRPSVWPHRRRRRTSQGVRQGPRDATRSSQSRRYAALAFAPAVAEASSASAPTPQGEGNHRCLSSHLRARTRSHRTRGPPSHSRPSQARPGPHHARHQRDGVNIVDPDSRSRRDRRPRPRHVVGRSPASRRDQRRRAAALAASRRRSTTPRAESRPCTPSSRGGLHDGVSVGPSLPAPGTVLRKNARRHFVEIKNPTSARGPRSRTSPTSRRRRRPGTPRRRTIRQLRRSTSTAPHRPNVKTSVDTTLVGPSRSATTAYNRRRWSSPRTSRRRTGIARERQSNVANYAEKRTRM